MSASLVGSEMCIRDRCSRATHAATQPRIGAAQPTASRPDGSALVAPGEPWGRPAGRARRRRELAFFGRRVVSGS
eukprot:172710-Alexandrium_andersonii.AAC.1